MRFIAGLLGGFILAVLGALIITITLGASPEQVAKFGAASFLLWWIVGIVIALTAKSASKSWRRLLLLSAVLSFLLPISGLVYTGSLIASTVDPETTHAAAQTAGMAIGGGLVSGILGFAGFFLGVIFLIVGLLTGRDKRVIYVQTTSGVSISGDDKQRSEPQLND